jgi:chemotaxis protein methyltransferase CheR
MQRSDCVAFLQWCLPRMRMRWPGFRRVRSQVCKRIARRIAELGLESLDAYRGVLEANPDEWSRLDRLCRITISRFFRDQGVFEALASTVLPALAASARERGDDRLRVWSCGCASGEEPYTVAMMWDFELAEDHPELELEVLGTDCDLHLLVRARTATSDAGSLRDLPGQWRCAAFEQGGGRLTIRQPFREAIIWCCQDVRQTQPASSFDLVLCRNLVFTYYEPSLQLELARRLAGAVCPGGALVIGAHEALPPDAPFAPWLASEPIYRRLRASLGRTTARPVI